jgi:hypothetical protein
VRLLVILGVLLLCGPISGAATPAAPVAPLPRRAKPQPDGRYLSPLGFRDTVEWYRKELRRGGIQAEVTPPIRSRDVVYVRILAKDTGLPWSAVHIVLAEGRTTIYIVATFSADAKADAIPEN